MAAESYEVEGTIRLSTPLHVGSGRGDERTDATVVRDARGTPYIPGSSLRGVLRSSIEAWAPAQLSCRGLAERPGHCARTEERPLSESRTVQAEAASNAQTPRQWTETLLRRNGMAQDLDRGEVMVAQGVRALIQQGNRSEELLARLLAETLCTTCRLFGSLDWASPLHIADLYPIAGTDDVPREVVRWLERNPDRFLASVHGLRGAVRHGVGIDRETGAAREKLKYDFEVLPGGYTFRMGMRLELSPELSAEDAAMWLALLALGLRLLETESLTLGGRAARGVGQVRLELTRVAVVPMAGTALLDALIGARRNAEGILRPLARQEWTADSSPGVDEWIAERLTALGGGSR